MVRVCLCTLLAAIAAPAQNGSQLREWKPGGEAMLRPKTGCADLRALTGYGFTVVTAALAPAEGELPEHCRVVGQILPEIQFEVALPSGWNGRFYMHGNGGFAGESLEAPPRLRHRNLALRHGFATASTNTGHDARREPLASFAVDRQKLYDYAFRSLHVTAETAKQLMQVYYGLGPRRSYFDGCSTGGRQGLILAQRFPNDFDGIVVGAPVLNFTGTMVAYNWMHRALGRAPIPLAKVKLLAERIYAQCDDKDGLKDGLIDDPRRCGFQPERDLPRCAGHDQADCFTSAQIATLETYYGDVMIHGQRYFPGWPVGAEVLANGRSGWEPWVVREDGPTISHLFAESFFRYMAFPEKNPDWFLPLFDFDRDPPRLEWLRPVLDATETDLTRFRARGGKIVMYYGWADAALNPLMGLEYYENVAARMGPSTADFFRLFMVPGMFHCAGGVGASTFDALTPLIGWVEKGAAPQQLAAARIVEDKTVRTRPLCPHPAAARYKGTGSIDEAANFTCAAGGVPPPPDPGRK